MNGHERPDSGPPAGWAGGDRAGRQDDGGQSAGGAAAADAAGGAIHRADCLSIVRRFAYAGAYQYARDTESLDPIGFADAVVDLVPGCHCFPAGANAGRSATDADAATAA